MKFPLKGLLLLSVPVTAVAFAVSSPGASSEHLLVTNNDSHYAMAGLNSGTVYQLVGGATTSLQVLKNLRTGADKIGILHGQIVL